MQDFKLIIKLWHCLSKRRQKQFWLLLILMIIASLFEVISVGMVLPFIGVLASPEQIYYHPLAQTFINFLQITDSSQLALPITIFFIFIILLTGLIRLILLYSLTRLSFATGADISIDIYRRNLYQEYSYHVSQNSSELINSIITKINIVINGIINPVLLLISSIIIIIGIMSVLFIINIFTSVTMFLCFGLLYLVVITYTRKRLKINSKHIADQSTLMVKSLQEGLGGIRDVLIDGSQQFYCQLYRKSDLLLRKASADNIFISSSPRFVVEAVGMIVIALLAYILMYQQNGIISVIPTLGALALGAQRLLPVIQQSYASYTHIKGSRSSFQDILKLLDRHLPDYINQPKPKPLSFRKEIKLKNLSFRFNKKSPWILKNVNLKLTKGERIGFIGATGAGKSTLIDVIMGLLSPEEGELIVDNHPISKINIRSWQMRISHVPQNIYLSDSSIEENIAFGLAKDEINSKQVKKVARQAQISELIESWEDGYNTFVGERGVKLSGGQRQRLGIARALYKEADVLIFDEATSALDNETEKAIMASLDNLSGEITVLIIAHRLTTLKDCDQIIKIGKNNKIHILKYEEI